MAHTNVTIVLIENSSAGNPPKTFTNQTVKISHEGHETPMGVDGKLHFGAIPIELIWSQGSAAILDGITDIQVYSQAGSVLLEAEILPNFPPRDTAAGVEFKVL